MMEAGIQGRVGYGATDESGRRAEEQPATVWDFSVTVLHLLGFEHEELTWNYKGLDRRLADVYGHVIIKGTLACVAMWQQNWQIERDDFIRHFYRFASRLRSRCIQTLVSGLYAMTAGIAAALNAAA